MSEISGSPTHPTPAGCEGFRPEGFLRHGGFGHPGGCGLPEGSHLLSGFDRPSDCGVTLASAWNSIYGLHFVLRYMHPKANPSHSMHAGGSCFVGVARCMWRNGKHAVDGGISQSKHTSNPTAAGPLKKQGYP